MTKHSETMQLKAMRSHTLRNTLFSSVGLYTEYVLGMLTSIIIARHLGPDGFGAYSLVIWLVAMGVATTNSGTASAAIKFVAELRGGGREDLIPTLLAYLRRVQRTFLLVVLGVSAAIFLQWGDDIAPELDQRLLLAFLLMAVALRAGYMFNIGVAKGFENFRATAIVALVSTPLNLLLVVLAWWFDAPVEWLLGIFVASSVVFYLMSRWQVAPLTRSLARPAPVANANLSPKLMSRVRRHMGYSVLTVTVGFLVASEVEVLFLNLYANPEAAGQFKVAYQLAIGATMLVPGVFGALLLPMMANALSQGHEVAGRRFVTTTGYLALLAAPLVAFGVVLSGPIIQLLYGDAYAAAAPVFAVCLAGAAALVVTQSGSSLLVSADRQHHILVLVAACGILKVALDAVLIAGFGLDGAVMAYAFTALTTAAATMGLAIRVSRISPDWKKLSRTALAALLAGLVVLPWRGALPPLAAIATGGLLIGAVYLPLTLLLGCWSRGDIEYLQQLHQRFAASRPRAGARLLAWAHRRTPERGVP